MRSDIKPATHNASGRRARRILRRIAKIMHSVKRHDLGTKYQQMSRSSKSEKR